MTSRVASRYPRPDYQRGNLHWESLDGPWDFVFDDADVGLENRWQQDGLPPQILSKIKVPFVFQCKASGIDERGVHEVLWYQRRIRDLRSSDDRERGNRLLLRFGAVDYHATVWLDGFYIGEHRGGHVPFDLDLTEALSSSGVKDSYKLTVRVYDSAYDLTQPRGKQYWGPQPEDIYYTPSSGIWQSVWLENVPSLRIADSSHGTILRSNDIQGGILDARIAVHGRRAQQKCSVEIEVSFHGLLISSSGPRDLPREENFVRFDHSMRLSNEQLQQLPAELLRDAPLQDTRCWRDGVALWSPERPALYDLTLRLRDADGRIADEVKTTTGMRSIQWATGDGTYRLNGHPYFHALFLDQGYWPETLMTPPSQDALKQDIILSKAMGFNGCRKHQKVEDPVFMYWANRLGYLVWGEMASCYNFSMDMVDRFDREWMEMVRRDINHPCIVAWTPANESWGYPDLGRQIRQRDHLRSLYYMTKTLDPTRPINDNCGWEHVKTDLTTFHDYSDANGMAERCASTSSIVNKGRSMFLSPIVGLTGEYDPGSQHQSGAPVLCTEFGGVNIALQRDDSRKENWGYTTAKDSQDLLKRVDGLIMAVVGSGTVCGIVWTQLTDVEQEMNGLYTYDRREKVPASEVAKVLAKARNTYYSKLKPQR
ncbi:glycoside hydrolase family 2 protein [Acidomyces richmondensis BFW]|nr:MAG: glycoside hydrolase family 2 protein [Acidomyces sp. 'richmondensis']KYG41086.1 glycoside hydrolase family 2 protein [Acidomyces richmondensis BFW]